MKELFKNKTQMKKHVKTVLNSWDTSEDSPELILWLISEYRGKQVDLVWVQKDNYGNNQFATEGGSFSYIKAVDFVYGKVETSKQRFAAAMRRHLIPHMKKIKTELLLTRKVCLHTGKSLDMKSAHVDHVCAYEFSDIIDMYLTKIELNDIVYISTDNGDFVNDEVFDAFKIHHDTYAVLEVVHSSWNLSRGKTK